MSGVTAAFEPETRVVAIEAILPVKRLASGVKATRRFQMIADSIAEVGIIEPPVVFPDRKRPGTYLLLDGHLRVEILKDRGEREVFCLGPGDPLDRAAGSGRPGPRLRCGEHRVRHRRARSSAG